jgi:AcrR family transcriptional regulator
VPAPGKSGEHATRETRERLIDAAGEVFAERGFRAATTREICARAAANCAAVNYHFGDKERLYEEVLRHADRYAAGHYPLAEGAGRALAPVQRLLAFVSWYLDRVLGAGRPAWQGKVMVRAMQESVGALEALAQSEFRRRNEALEALCREIMGAGSTAAQARLAARSVIGQCYLYSCARPLMARLYPEERYRPADIRRLARQITEFSLGGMARLAAGRGRGSAAGNPGSER